ncbi:hypothetical protein [Lysobacter sp. A289]
MGVLGNQPSREDYRVSHQLLDAHLHDFVDLAKKHGVSVETVIEAKRVLEMDRRNSMESLAGDYHDEHMGGLGQILSRIAEALEREA